MKISADKFKQKVKESGLPVRDIAIAAGYQSDARIYQLCDGRGTNINPRIGEALAKKLKCKVADITV